MYNIYTYVCIHIQIKHRYDTYLYSPNGWPFDAQPFAPMPGRLMTWGDGNPATDWAFAAERAGTNNDGGWLCPCFPSVLQENSVIVLSSRIFRKTWGYCSNTSTNAYLGPDTRQCHPGGESRFADRPLAQ